MTPRLIARHLAHPKGIFGRWIAGQMNRRNAAMNAFTVQALEVKPTDRVLEIGFGGGVTLPALLGSARFVYGVDRSVDMVRLAQTRHRVAVAQGRAAFHCAEIEHLPFAPAEFDKVCTVNTVYFWRSLADGFAQISRILKPGGRVAVGFLPADAMLRLGVPRDLFALRHPSDVVHAMGVAGFVDIRAQRPSPEVAWNTIVATPGGNAVPRSNSR